MIKVDYDKNHISIDHKIENDEQFVNELVNVIDFIVAEKILSSKELSQKENIERAVSYRNEILKQIINKDFQFSECYTEEDLISYEKA